MVNTELARGPLNFVEIKNPFGSLKTNVKADAWWFRQLVLEKFADLLKDIDDDEIIADILEVLRVRRQPCQRV